MARNLKYQLNYCVNSNFKEKIDKYSLKTNGGTGNSKIYSYSDRQNLLDFTCNFANYMKQEHPEIKMARDIKTEHIQSFLSSKANNCTQNTLKQYVSKVNKMEKLINATYNTDLKFNVSCPKAFTESSRTQQMSQEHYNKLINNMREGNGRNGLMMAKEFGLRVSEVVNMKQKDIDLNKGVVRVIGGKGGRNREVPINTSSQRNLAEKLYNSVTSANERIVPIKEDSVNQSLNRAMDRLNIKNEYKDSGIHSARKLYAQNEYDRLRAEGMEIKEALGQVSENLGHSRERGEDKDLINRYVQNIY